MKASWPLRELLKNIVATKPTDEHNLTITGLALDSRKITKGDLFFAIKGAALDGHNFVKDAIAKGAAAILCEDIKKAKQDIADLDTPPPPILEVDDLKGALIKIANRFFKNPSSKLKLIGITGTNGKTSVSHLLANAFTILNKKTAIIGTMGTGFPNKLDTNINTTPDAITIQGKLDEFVEEKTFAVTMEVSSHALDQKRVAELTFDTAIFTNLTQDHLDYHQDMENYFAAKRKLFFMPNLKNAIINIDDEYGRRLLQDLPKNINVFAFSVENNKSHLSILPEDAQIISAENIKLTLNGVTAKIKTPWGNLKLKSSLLGKFNVSNLLAAITTLGLYGIEVKEIEKAISKLKPIPGRLQTLGGGKKPLVIVDYSHTPDALEKALEALRHHAKGQIWCIFGCGGDRDRKKRPLMGAIAERLSDQIIITSDNPRTEDPKTIIDEIVTGLTCPWGAEIEADRAIAIAHAINCASAQDMVLIAGKGHEDYQILGEKRIHFSDVEEAEKALLNYRGK